MTEAPIRDIAMHFEAVKVSMSQDKNGVILRLNVHPNDCPKELHTDWVGTRYVVAMVRLQDDETPDDRGYVAVQRLIASAGLLCRNEEFFAFLVECGMAEPTTSASEMEERSADVVRKMCGIKSRSEFRDNEAAREKFEALRNDFKQWKRGQANE